MIFVVFLLTRRWYPVPVKTKVGRMSVFNFNTFRQCHALTSDDYECDVKWGIEVLILFALCYFVEMNLVIGYYEVFINLINRLFGININ